MTDPEIKQFVLEELRKELAWIDRNLEQMEPAQRATYEKRKQLITTELEKES